MMGRWWPAVLTLTLLCFTPEPGDAREVPASEDVSIGKYVRVPSEILGRDQTILVSLPGGYSEGQRKYPVVYLLDGHVVPRFAQLAAVVAIESEAGKLPGMIVVGIDTRHDYARNTFPTPLEGWPGSGGADRFLDFMESELFPFVEAQYRAEPYRVLIGQSNTGLQMVYALLTRPGSFGNVVACSPALGWCADFVVETVRSWTAPDCDRECSLIITQGSDDYPDVVIAGIRTFVEELQKQAPAGLGWSLESIPNGGHVPLRSFELGLSRLFRGYAFPLDSYDRQGLDGVVKHYRSLSERYGFVVEVPATLLDAIGHGHLQKREWREAARVFDLWVASDAANPVPHYFLAVAHKEMGDRGLAERHCRRALEIASGFGRASRLLKELTGDTGCAE